MCGIAGFLTTDRGQIDRALLEKMCDAIAHRGPDGEGYFCDEWAALGHRRLSIIDLAGGHQPLGNEDGSIQVVFNGEIYNYRELRADLIKKGHHLRTASDTEVLVHLYEEVGERLPEHLNGMFAFAIWDARKRELFLARDRFGEKPLYYSFTAPGMQFCFASELKALTPIPGFSSKLDAHAVADFLSFGYIPDPGAIYKDVFKLEPGRSLTVTPSGHRSRRYWKPEFNIDTNANPAAVVESIDALARDSVEIRMISDVPLGAFLSGGVDSSGVVAYMAQRAPDSVKTFSIGFTEKKFDELEYARLMASKYSTDHRDLVVTPTIHDVLDTLVNHYDEPFGDSSAIPTLYLSELTRRHVTVALSGDGADELFAGYRRYLFGIFEERARGFFPSWFRNSFLRLGARYYPKFDYLPRVFRAKATLTGLSSDLGNAYFNAMSQFRDEGLQAVLSPEMRKLVGDYSPRRRYVDRFKPFAELPPLQQLQAVDLETYLPGDILVKVDRATMAHSLESRAPWLDHRLAELACSLPADLKLHGKIGKYAFKQALSRHIPEQLISRPKMGFGVPLQSWFQTSLKPIFESAVLNDSMAPYFSLGEVRRLWQEHQRGLRSHESKLWYVLMFACWNARHREKTGDEALFFRQHHGSVS